MKTQEAFAGDKKVGKPLLHVPEQWLVRHGAKRVPAGVETYHLTLMTVLWTALALGCAWMAQGNLWWMAGVSLMIGLQYVTDLFDGAVGRMRNTGLVKWGFYMDHMLDFVFNGSILVCYAMIAPEGSAYWFMGLMILCGGMMVNSFLSFAATNKFEIYFNGVGPTEIRLALIVFNTTLPFTGVTYFTYAVPAAVVVGTVVLAGLAYRTHRILWEVDMRVKRESEEVDKAA